MSSEGAYELLDSGDGAKLERFGPILLDRPSPQALWQRRLPSSAWERADARFERDASGGGWSQRTPLPESWICEVGAQRMLLRPTSFGHVGVFTEQSGFWEWIREESARALERLASARVLNLFAYTGGSSIAAARGGAEVTHCDASRGIVQWASESAALNELGRGSIRWIIDDAQKFLAREARRGNRYHGIVLDPPSFGRGPKGQVFKLEDSMVPLLEACVEVLDDDAEFLLLSAHTPGIGAVALANLLSDALGGRSCRRGEMVVRGGNNVAPLPSGQWACWSRSGSAPEETETR